MSMPRWTPKSRSRSPGQPQSNPMVQSVTWGTWWSTPRRSTTCTRCLTRQSRWNRTQTPDTTTTWQGCSPDTPIKSRYVNLTHLPNQGVSTWNTNQIKVYRLNTYQIKVCQLNTPTKSRYVTLTHLPNQGISTQHTYQIKVCQLNTPTKSRYVNSTHLLNQGNKTVWINDSIFIT